MTIHQAKTVNDVIFELARKARELANLKMDDLRRQNASAEAHSENAAQTESWGKSRGEIIEEILLEELEESPSRDIQETV